MSFVRAYIALGSNKDYPLQQVNYALTTLQKLASSKFILASSLYQSPPLGPKDQANFVNAVAVIDTELSASELLQALQAIEQQQGRMKTRHWGERTLDLDILLYGNEIIKLKNLIVPHPEIKNRNFVLYPLAEIVPELIFPDGETLQNCLLKISTTTLIKLKTVN